MINDSDSEDKEHYYCPHHYHPHHYQDAKPSGSQTFAPQHHQSPACLAQQAMLWHSMVRLEMLGHDGNALTDGGSKGDEAWKPLSG